MNNLKQGKEGWLNLAAPAKVNLMLSVHGRREDGFHELTSVIAAVDFGDELAIRLNDEAIDSLVCDHPALPLDASNLVLQAARRFREATGLTESFDFCLKKRTPVGAGLGGGSSDGVAALKGMDRLLGTKLGGDRLRALAATLGSDCPFFVDAAPAVMTGRGEHIEPLPGTAAAKISGQRLVLFRPDFGINTAWAYGELAAMAEPYERKDAAEARLSAFFGNGTLDGLLFNSFEQAIGQKYLAISSLLEILRSKGCRCLMSGSGSACFAIVKSDEEAADLKAICQDSWGTRIFWVETSLSEKNM